MKRILFVDDESAVLDGIRSLLRKRRKEWQMEFAESGESALKLMESQPVDLICSDMRMTQMDGSVLLTKVSERWPKTVRVVLSGYSDLMQAIGSLPVAHCALSKPCGAEHLQSTIERCLRVRELLDQPALVSLIDRAGPLPPLPTMSARLREETTRSNVTAGEVAKIVVADEAIASTVLKVANLPSFRLANQVTNIEQAISHLGFAAIKNLILSVEVLSLWPGDEKINERDLSDFSADALKVSAMTRALASGTAFFDDAIVAGMLRDIGYLILHSVAPDELAASHRLAKERQVSIVDIEREFFGVSHAEVGAYLLAHWGLPFNVIEAVAYHNDALSIRHTEYDLLSAVALALALTHGRNDRFGTPFKAVPDQSLLTSLHAPFSWEKALTTATQVKSALVV